MNIMKAAFNRKGERQSRSEVLAFKGVSEYSVVGIFV